MTEQQAIEALHALPRLPRSGASLERMQALLCLLEMSMRNQSGET